MNWLLSPWGLVIVIVVIFGLATLVYWKREPIKKWFKRKELSEIEIGAGPVKAKLTNKKKAEPEDSSRAGVSFGEGNDFTGAKIKDVTGRDKLQGVAAKSRTGGKTPGVDFGKKGKFINAEVEDITGRDKTEA
ncbi:MAG: hypothetical protein ACP5J4_21710 [Anaerolineae bacterium]